MKTTVGFGDFLASFSPRGYERFTQAHSYDVTFTGAEANVLVSLSRLGLPVRFVTRVPATDIGDAALMQLNSFFLRRPGRSETGYSVSGKGRFPASLQGHL